MNFTDSQSLEDDTVAEYHILDWNWTIVEFSDNNMEVRAIPKFWIQLNNKVCAWPHYNIENRIEQSIEERDEPDATWKKRNISNIFESSGIIM